MHMGDKRHLRDVPKDVLQFFFGGRLEGRHDFFVLGALFQSQCEIHH